LPEAEIRFKSLLIKQIHGLLLENGKFKTLNTW